MFWRNSRQGLLDGTEGGSLFLCGEDIRQEGMDASENCEEEETQGGMLIVGS